MKKKMLFMLVAVILATQCACDVPAELQGLTEEEILSLIQTAAAEQEAISAEAGAMTAEEVKIAAEAVQKASVSREESEEVQTVDQVIAAYNSNCIEVNTPAKESDVYHPVSIVQCACYDGDCYILYPKVQEAAGAELINNTICAKVAEQAAALGMPVLTCYKVEYNRNGIFSLRMLLYDLYGNFEEYLTCVPMTFNVETGELYSLNDFFNSEDQSWRGRIPDIITTQAADSNMVLLSDILPVADDQPFYITDEAVVITYDLYEIATYSAGEPEFEISVGELAEYIAPDGILNVFLTPAPSAEVNAAPEKPQGMEAALATPVPAETAAQENAQEVSAETPSPTSEPAPEAHGADETAPINDSIQKDVEVVEP